jgi:hypothetical protein
MDGVLSLFNYWNVCNDNISLLTKLSFTKKGFVVDFG